MPKKSSKPNANRIESVRHKDKRKNIPTEELRDFVRDDENAPKKLLYPRDPDLDPQLVWKGKDEQDSTPLEVPAVPDVQVKSAEDGATGNLGLELTRLAVLFGRPAAVGATIRQRHVDDLVGLAAGNRAMSFGAVVFPALAARRGGPVTVEEADVNGVTVSRADRVVHEAAGAEVWLSSEAKSHVDQERSPQHASLQWVSRRGVEFKGFPGKHTLYLLARR